MGPKFIHDLDSDDALIEFASLEMINSEKEFTDYDPESISADISECVEKTTAFLLGK